MIKLRKGYTMKQFIITALTVAVLVVILGSCGGKKSNNNNKIPLNTTGSSDNISTAFVNDGTTNNTTTTVSDSDSEDKAGNDKNDEIDADELFGDSNGQTSSAGGQQTGNKSGSTTVIKKTDTNKTQPTADTTTKALDEDGDGYTDEYYHPGKKN